MARTLRQLEDSRQDFLRALDCLSDDELRFVPREGLWSLGQVACHVAGSEDGWLRLVLGERIERFPRYSADDYPTVASLKELLATEHAATEAQFAGDAEASCQALSSLHASSTS